MIESPTPRTDAAVNDIGRSGVDWHYSACKLADFSRHLERELTAALKENEHLNKALKLKFDAMPSGLSAGQSMKMDDEIKTLKLKCAKMQSALERAETWFSRPRNDIMLGVIREALKGVNAVSENEIIKLKAKRLAMLVADLETAAARANVNLRHDDFPKSLVAEFEDALSGAQTELERENASLRAELFRLREAFSRDKAVLVGPLK